MAVSANANKMIYTLDDVPPKKISFLVALQHIFTTFGINVTVPLLIGPLLKMNPEQMSILISATLLTSGVTTLLQANFGSRLPIFQGSAFAFIAPYVSIIAAVGAAGPEVGMQTIAGALILGAFFQMIIGFFGLIGRLQKFVSPVVIGPMIAVIGLSMYRTGATQAASNWFLSILTIVAVFVFALILGPKHKNISIISILLAIIFGYFVALITGQVNFDSVVNAPWFRTNLVFPWGLPKFNLGFALLVLAGYLSTIIAGYGNYHAVNAAAEGKPLTTRQINNGIAFEGVGSFLSGLWGGFASTSFVGNVGLVGLTRVGSRVIMNYAAVILILMGVFGKFGGAVSTIPRPVAGGLFCVLFGLIAAMGIRATMKADVSSMRNILIIGFIIYMGLSLPVYFENTPLVTPWAPWLGELVTALGKVSIAVTAILGLILDNLIPGTPEERGLMVQKAEDVVEIKGKDAALVGTGSD